MTVAGAGYLLTIVQERFLNAGCCRHRKAAKKAFEIWSIATAHLPESVLRMGIRMLVRCLEFK